MTDIVSLRAERGRLSKTARDAGGRAAKRVAEINVEIQRLQALDAQIADERAHEERIAERTAANARAREIAAANAELTALLNDEREICAEIDGHVNRLVGAIANRCALAEQIFAAHRAWALTPADGRCDLASPSQVRHRLAIYLAARLGQAPNLGANLPLQNAFPSPACRPLAESETEHHDQLLRPEEEVTHG